MTERTPRDAFEEIVGNLQNEMLDPVIEPLFRRVHEYVTQLDGECITKKDAAMIRDELKHMLYDIDPEARDIFVRVSGKARLLPGTDVSILTNSRYTSHLQALQPGITERFDDEGSYYPLHRQLAALDYISVTPNGEWVDGAAPHRISYHLTLSVLDYDEYAEYDQEDEDEDEDGESEYNDEEEVLDNDQVDIIIYGAELSALERADASHEQTIRDLRRYFPEVAAQLDAIPNDAMDEMDTVRAIKDLALVFDWSKAPYPDADARQALIDVISNILTEKLGLDNTMYQITYQGLVGGIQPDGTHIHQVQSGCRTLNGIIVGTMIEKIDDPDVSPDMDISEHYVGVFISAPAYGRDRGDMLITMPLTSIMGLTNLRNDPVFTAPSATHPPMATPRAMEPLSSADEQDEARDQPAMRSSLPATPERKRLSETDLEQYYADFNQFWTTMQTYNNKVFTSYEGVKEAQQYLTAMMQEFFGKHAGFRNMRMSFSGECVEYIVPGKPGSLVVEKVPLRLELTDNILHKGDMTTQRTGWFAGNISVSVVSNNDEESPEFRIRPYMFLVDNGIRGMIGTAPENAPFSVSLYEMRYQSMIRFAVNLTSPGGLELIELEQTRHFNESIAKLAREAPDKIQLPAYLSDIFHEIESELPDAMISIGVENLRAVAEQVRNDQAARKLTTEVLAGMFGERFIIVKGKIYDANGDEQATELNAKLLTVLDAAPSAKLPGPVLVMLDGNDLRYVPVTELTGLQI